MLVSVIIPVFNCEKYIEECLASVCSQSLTDLEILCIDDGSEDKTCTIIEKYMETEHRIALLRQKNQGAGIARNKALQMAKGDFVIFLDADDYYLNPEALMLMYSKCLNKHVNACGSSLYLMRRGNISRDTTLQDVLIASDCNDVLNYIDYQFDYGYTGFLLNRKLLIDNNIFFPKYRRFQDPPFFVRAMYLIGKFCFCDTKLYCYRVPYMVQRFSRDKVRDLVLGLKDNIQFALEHHLEKLFSRSLMRIEYEYYSIICHQVTLDDYEIVDILQQISSLVSNYEKKRYIIRPLKFIQNEPRDYFEKYEDRMQELIMSSASIYLYGAGGFSQKFVKYLNYSGLVDKVRGIITTDGKDSQTIGISTIEKGELDSPVFVVTGAVFHKEIAQTLEQKGIDNYYLVDSVFLERLPMRDNDENECLKKLYATKNIVIFGAGIIAKEVFYCLREKPYQFKISNFLVTDLKNNPEQIEGIPVISVRQDSSKKSDKLVLIAVMDKYYEDIQKNLKNNGYQNILCVTFESIQWSIIREKYFECLYREHGKDFLLLDKELDSNILTNQKQEKVEIYNVKCHLDKVIVSNEDEYRDEIPIQVGAKLTEKRISSICDDINDNISIKNKEFCELTAIYWIWKNSHADYVGICHYRRHYVGTERIIEQLPHTDIDIILTIPVLNYPSVKEIYFHDHFENDWNIMLDVIRELQPQYYDTAIRLQEGTFYYAYNMMIAKKKIYDRYCSWLFPLLFLCEQRCEKKNDPYQNRYIGFLAERLLSVFVLHHENEYKIVHTRKVFLK